MPFKDRSPVLEMSEFGWPLTVVEDIEYLPPKHVWPEWIIIPRGTETDLASTPRIFWRIFPPFGRYSQAAIVHDYLYNYPSHLMTRELADKVFLEAMVELGVSWLTRTSIHSAVRVGGWYTWNKARKEKRK